MPCPHPMYSLQVVFVSAPESAETTTLHSIRVRMHVCQEPKRAYLPSSTKKIETELMVNRILSP